MQIVEGESGMEFVTMNVKEFKSRERMWFILGVVALIIGLAVGVIIGDLYL